MDVTHSKTFSIVSSNTTVQALYACEEWYRTLKCQYMRLQPELKASIARIRLILLMLYDGVNFLMIGCLRALTSMVNNFS